jgi:hypothetical protein
MQQPSLRDLRDRSPRRSWRSEDAVQACTHPGSRGSAPVQAAEALDVDRQGCPGVPVLRPCPTCLLRRSRRIRREKASSTATQETLPLWWGARSMSVTRNWFGPLWEN